MNERRSARLVDSMLKHKEHDNDDKDSDNDKNDDGLHQIHCAATDLRGAQALVPFYSQAHTRECEVAERDVAELWENKTASEMAAPTRWSCSMMASQAL